MRIWALPLVFTLCLFAESAAGVRWTAPAGWKSEGPRPMRAASYAVPATQPDTENGECVVYFFGAGQGGGIEANIERWKGQFQSAGKPPAAKVNKKTVNTLPVTTIDMSGTYTGMGGPMVAQKIAKPGYRLLGVIIEAPGGNLFVKFTGPARTVSANQQKFEQFVASFKKN